MENFLLDKKYHFILKIIDEISQTDSKEISFVTLENKLKLTKKTIRTYLETLIDYCQENNLKTFELHDGKLKMISDTNFNIFNLYHYFVQDSIKYQIMLSIFNNPGLSFTNLYLDLLISKSNCSLHIKQLNKFFAPYDCKINFLKSNPIEGDEHQIRFLFYNMFWGLDQSETIDESPKLNAVTDLLLESVPFLSYATLSKIRLNFYIFQVASKHGFFLNKEVDFTIADSPFITYDDFFQKLDALDFFEFCPDLATKQAECRYLYFQFCRQNILTLEVCQDFEDQITYSPSPNVQYLITQFQKTFHLELEDYEMKCLSYNLSLFFQEASLFKGQAKTFDLEKLVNIFNKSRKNTSKSIENFLADLCNQNKEIKTLMRLFPSLSLYCTMLLRVIIAKHQPPLKLLVQSNISTLHREALISQIKNSTPFPITILNFNQLNDEKPDGIISNWLPDKKYEDIPFFSTSFFFTEWDKGELSQFLSQLASKKLSG